MLIRTAKEGDGYTVGSSVTVTIKEVKGSAVRVNFKAPPSVGLWREELYRKVVDASETPRPGDKPAGGNGLTLTCRPDESVFIGDPHTFFKVLGINGRRVQIGIQAPPDVKINRVGEKPKTAKPVEKIEVHGIEVVDFDKGTGGPRTYTARSSSLAKVAERVNEVGRNPAPTALTGSPARDLPRTHIVRSAGSNAPRLPRDIALAARGKSGKNNGWSR